jgi:hypothetical protein
VKRKEQVKKRVVGWWPEEIAAWKPPERSLKKGKRKRRRENAKEN